MDDGLEHVEDSVDIFTNKPMDLEQIKLTLAIMHLDPADRAVIRIADQRDAMQKRAFTIWVNKHLSEHGFFVNDLFRDFQSGHLLIKLIEILSGQSLSVEYGPTRVHCIQNVQRVLEFLQFRKVRIVNIRPDEIVDGNPKLTLGLIWIIILHFHLSDLLHLPSGVVVGKENALPPDLIIPEGRLILNNGSSSLQSLALLDETAGRNLLSWCRAVTTGYRGVDINDFSSSWSDGRAFLAIIHRYKPHFFDYPKAASRPPKDILDFAFHIAEERLGITRLIYPEDMVATENAVDSRSVIVYVSSLYDALALSPRDLITGCRQILPIPPLPVDVDVAMAPPPLGSQLVTTADVSDEIRSLWSEYRLLAAELIQWLRATCDRLAVRHFPADLESMQQQVVNDLKRHRREELPLRERQRQQLVRLYADLQSAANANLLTIDPFMNIEHIFRLWKEYELALQKREMAVAAETSRLERLQLAGERIERECRVLKTQEAALEKRINEMESQFASSQSIDIDGELKRWMTQMEVVETGVNDLFGQVQILRNGRYIRTEQVYRKVCTLHQRLLELQRRCRNFLKVTLMNQSGDRIQALRANGDSWMAVPDGRSSNSLRWLAKQSKHFGALQAAQAWMQERKEAIENAPFGDNRKSIADATKRFELIHREIEKFHSKVEGCQALRAQVSGDEVKFFEVLMNQIEIQYDELMKKSKRRLEFGRSLLVFVERASNSMQWLREKETIEVTRIWSSPHELKSDEIYEFFRGLLREIQSQEQQFNEISTLGSSLHLEGHPSFDLIQTYLTSLDSHWAWLLQLTHCLETRLDQTVRFQQFFTEAQKVETFLTTKMKEINDMNLTSASGDITVEIASEFMKKIADMGEVIRGQGFLVDKLVETSDEIGNLAFRNDPHETVISICFFAPNSEPHYMELAPEQSDPAIITWPSGNFKKGERMTIFAKPSEFTLKLRHSNGEEIEAPAVCFLPAHPCLEAKTRAQDVVARFQRLQVFWADTELNLHGRLLKATMQALPGTLPNLSAAEGQQLMRQLHEDTQRHLVGMRLANKPIQEVEVFQQESEQSFKSLPNGNGSAVDPIEKNETTDLKRIETTLNALADHLRKRTGQVLPNQLSTLEVVLKEHKEWSRSVNQIRDHLERMPDEQGSASTGSTIDKSGCAALLAAANELNNAGKATAHRLAEVDAILTRLDSLQRELAGAELKVVGIAARIHSPQQNLSNSKSSLHSDVSEMEANNVQDIHDQLKNVTLALGGLRKMLEQLPHHLTALSTLGVTKGTSAGNHRLPPPNTSLLEKSIFSVNTRLGNLINQLDLMNQELVKISQNYKTVITLRRGLTLWLRETSDLVEAVEMRLKNRSHGNLASSTAARNLERASAEAVHCEAKLKELNQTCEFLARLLEDSAGRGDAYKRAVSCLTFASMETANTRFVGPPGIGVIDLVSLGTSAANLNTRFQALKSKIADNLAVIRNATDEAGEVQSSYNTISSHRSMGSTQSLLSLSNDVGDYFVTGGSRRRRRRKISPSVPLEQSQMKRRPLTLKPTRYCVVSGFYLTSPKQSLRVETAITRAMIREGRVDAQRNLVYDSDSGAMITAGEALEKSVIVGLIFTKLAVKQTGETTYWLEIFHKRHDFYLVEGIFDVNARTLISVEEALASNLIDPVHGLYHHTGTEETITLEDAHQQGLIRVVPQLRPPCEDLATRPFDFIHYRTVEGDSAVWSSNVAFKQEVDLFVQQEETVKSGYANVVVKNSKLPLDLHLLGNLAPVTLTDGTAISAIKLPLVRRLVSQNIPTIEVTRREPQPAHRLSLATALRRGWIDSHSGGLRSACGSVSQVNLIEAVEQRFVDPNSIIVRIGGGGLDASNPGTRYYSLARVLEAANTIARAKRFASEAGWKNELLKILMTNNANAADGEVSENISPEDYSRLQSIIVHHGIKRTKGDKKMSLAKLTLKRKQKKGEQSNEKLSGEKMSLARAIQAGRFDPSTGIITTQTMQRITLKEAIELKTIDEEISLVQDERTGYYRSVSHYLNDGTTPIEVWLHWPMATILLPEEVESFGRKRVNRGQRIPYAVAQSLHLINPQSRTVFNPQIENYVSILNAFLEGPLCGQRTVIYFRTSQEYLPVDKLILSNPENVVNELLFNRSLCIELQEDIDDSGGGTHPPPHVTVKTSVDSIPSPILLTPVDLKTAVSLSWVDRQTGFVNDPYTGHRLLLKEAVSAGLIDADRTVIRDPVTHQTSTLNVILKSGEPINVPYIVQLACLEDSQEPSTQACSGQNQSAPLSPVTDGSFAMTPTTGELQVTNTSKGQEVNDERFLIEEEYPLEGKGKAGGKMFDEAMENAEKHAIIGLDTKKLRSDLADAAAKVGTGLAVALGAAGVGGTLAYQSIKEKIKRSNASHSQIQSPTVEENLIASGPIYADTTTKSSEESKRLFVPNCDKISTDDTAKRDDETKLVNDDVEDAKSRSTDISGSSVPAGGKELQRRYDEKTAFETDNEISPMDTDDALRSEISQMPMDNLEIANEGTIFLDRNDENLLRSLISAGNSIFGTQDVLHSISAEDGQRSGHDVQKMGENDERENLGISIEEMEFIDQDEDLSRPSHLANMEVPETNGEERSPLEEQGYSRPSFREHGMELKRTSPSTEGWEANGEGKEKTSGPEKYSTVKSSPIAQNHLHSVDSEDEAKCERILLKGRTMYPSEDTSVNFNAEDSQEHFVEKTPSIAEDGLQFGTTENKQEPNQETKEGKTELTDHCEKQAPGSSSSVNKVDEQKHVADPTMELSEATTQKPPGSSDSATSRDAKLRYEVDLIKNAGHIESSVISGANQNAEEPLESGFSGAENNLNKMSKGEPINSVVTQGAVALNQQSLSKHAPSLVANLADTSKEAKKGFDVKKVLINIGGVLTAAVGAPVVAGIMAYNAAKDKFESSPPSSKTQNKSLEIGESANVSLEPEKALTTGTNLKKKDKSGGILEENRLLRMGETDDLSNVRQCDLEEQQQQFQPPANFDDLLIPESNSFEDPGSKSPQKGEELPRNGTFNEQLASHDPNQAKDDLLETQKEVKSRERHDQLIEVLRNQGKVDLIQEGKPIQSLETGQNVCDSPRRSPESNSIRARERESVDQVKSPDSGAIDELTPGNDRPSKNKDERWRAHKWAYRNFCSSEAKVNKEATEKDYKMLAGVDQCKKFEIFKQINISHGLKIKGDDDNTNDILEKNSQRGKKNLMISSRQNKKEDKLEDDKARTDADAKTDAETETETEAVAVAVVERDEEGKAEAKVNAGEGEVLAGVMAGVEDEAEAKVRGGGAGMGDGVLAEGAVAVVDVEEGESVIRGGERGGDVASEDDKWLRSDGRESVAPTDVSGMEGAYLDTEAVSRVGTEAGDAGVGVVGAGDGDGVDDADSVSGGAGLVGAGGVGGQSGMLRGIAGRPCMEELAGKAEAAVLPPKSSLEWEEGAVSEEEGEGQGEAYVVVEAEAEAESAADAGGRAGVGAAVGVAEEAEKEAELRGGEKVEAETETDREADAYADADADAETETETEAVAVAVVERDEEGKAEAKVNAGEGEVLAGVMAGVEDEAEAKVRGGGAGMGDGVLAEGAVAVVDVEEGESVIRGGERGGDVASEDDKWLRSDGRESVAPTDVSGMEGAYLDTEAVSRVGTEAGDAGVGVVGAGDGDGVDDADSVSGGAGLVGAGGVGGQSGMLRGIAGRPCMELGFGISPFAIGVASDFSRCLFGVSCPLSLSCFLPGHLSGGLSPIFEEVSFPRLRFSGDRICSFPDSFVSRSMPVQPEVNYARLFSGLLKELDAESAWLLTRQERILNECSISLNDDDNQKLLDQYYEINNDLLTHKQVALAVCERAELLAKEAIASLPSEKRSLLETKAMEVRSAFQQLTQETDLRIHLLTASLDNLEQLTFQLQDLKAWLTSIEKSLKQTLETYAPHPESLSAMQAHISRVEHELLSRQTDLASVMSSAQKFLSCLEKYNSAKLEYASLVGVELPVTQSSAESIVPSVETAVDWTQNKFNDLKALAGEHSARYSDAAVGFSDFATGLAKCSESLDAAEKTFWQATRKLLAAGVDVNPRCEGNARAPANTQMITNPVLVKDQASCIFALEGHISHIKSALETLNVLADDLSKSKLPAVLISPSTIGTCLNKPLETEEARLSALSKELTSMKVKIKSLLSAIDAKDGSLGEKSAWLEDAIAAVGGKNESTLLEARQANNKLQAELSVREPGLQSLLRSAQEELEELEKSGEQQEATEKVKEKVAAAQKLVDKCTKLQSRLSRDQILLDELEQKSSLLDQASKNLDAFLESARSDLSAIESGLIPEGESYKRLKEIEEMKNSQTAEFNLFEEDINRLALEAIDLGRESDITTAKKKTAAAWAELSHLDQSIRQAHQTCKERLLRAKQFKTKRAKLLDWLESLEKRLNAGIFADCSTVEEVSLREQLKKLEKVTFECNALASEVESACGLLKPSENSSDDKLVQDAENLKNGCERLKSRISSMQSTAASSLRSLGDFSNAFMEADAWLTQRLNQISQLQLSSVDPQEILALTKKLNRFKDKLKAMAPQIDGLRRLGNELLNQKGAGKGSGRIREHMADVEKKWQALDAICKHRASELSETYSQALALDQCYSDLDNQLSRHSRAFEALSTVPVSKGHLQKLLFLQFGLIRTEPTVHAFEEAAGQFINSLPATTDASELSARVSGSRSRFDGLIGAIESRLETLQNTLCAKHNDAVLERQDLEEVDEQAIPTGDEETAKSKEIILKGSMFDEKSKGSKDEHFSASETDERGELEPLKGPPTETDSKTSKIDYLKERMAAFQAWLDLESRPVECPIFESGSYPVTRSNLTKAMQRVETFMTLIESRDKHLASLRAEAEVLCPDLLGDLEECQASLDHVKRRYTKKAEALQEILDKSKPIETELQSQQLTIDDLESKFLKDLGSTSRLESLQQDVMNREFPTLDSQIRDLEQTLSKLGDESSNQSAQPLRQQEVRLRHRLKQLESSLKRSIEGGQDGQKATSSLLTRADLIKRRMDELEAQVEVAGSEHTVLDPDTLSSRLEDVNKITDKLKQCDAALKSLKGDRKDLPQLSLLESLLKGLKRQSSRISQAADEATERLGQKIKVAQQLADQQKLLSSSLANARASSPIQPHKPLPTPNELKDYERQYLTPLRSQLQQLQKTGATLSEMSQPGLGRRRLEQDLTATEAAVDSLFAVVSSLKEHVGDASTLSTTQDNNARRLESLVQSVRDELEGQGALSPSPNALQLDALLNKLTGLRNLLQSRRGSLELLAEVAKADNHPDSVVKLIDDYQNVFAEVNSRIDKVSDALLCLKEFNSFYESYLGWLADAESRFSKLSISRDPAITYANRVAELGKLSQDCADKTDSVIQLQTRGTELLGLCPDSGASVIKEKMEHVGLSFTEFFDKVNNASQGLESARPDINRLLDSNAYLIETLPKLESRLRDGESTKIIGDELNSQVKPHVDSLTNALEEIRTNLPNALFLNLPSQLHSLTIGDLAVENVSRFNNLYSETMSASQKDQLLDMQVKNAYSKLRGDEKWLEQAMRRLDPKAQSQPPREILTLKEDTSPERASYSLAVLPACVDQIDYLISRLNAFQSQLAKRQPDIEAHLVEAKRLLDKVPYRNTEEDLAPTLEGLVKRIIQQNKEIDGLMDAADARSQQALALSKSLFDNLARLDTWMTSAENVLNQLPVAPLAVEEESDTLRKLLVAAKTLERELDGYKVTLEQASSTAAALSALTAPSEADGVDTRIQQSVVRFRKLAKRIRNRSIDLEDAVTNSIDVNDRLSVLHEVLNETRDLAATIGVRLEPPSHDLSPPHLPSEFDLTSIAPSARVLQPVSMRSEYLSSQIAEGKAILDTLERRLPALAELASSIEERLSAPASEMSSRVERPSLVLRLEEEPTIDASAMFRGKMLNKAQSLQKDWLQLQTKVSQRLTNLVEAHRLASEEFWLPLSNFQGDLIALRRAMDAVISGGAPRLPLEPSTYTSQIEALKNIRKQHEDSGERLNALQDVGNKIINLLIDETARSEGEKGILKKEINNAIREVSAIAQNITTTCEQQLVTAKDNLSTAQKLQTDLGVFMDQLEKAENEFEAFEPVANNTDVILKLMEQLEEWSALIPPRHEQLENLNWVAGQLMSVIGISEVPELLPSKVGGDTKEGEQGPQVQQMLTLATTRWSNLNDAINRRRHKLQTQLMALGDLDSALDALIQWIKMTQADIDGISVSRGDKKSLEFELSRARIIQTNAARRQPDMVRINQEAKAMRQTKVLSKLTHMNCAWERLKQSVVRKQAKLEEALREAQSFYSRLDELRRECRRLEGKISAPAARLIGGLPDSAKQSLNRFLQLHNSVEKLGRQIGDLRSSSAGLLASASSKRDHLLDHLDSLSQQQAQLAAQAQERLKQVQSGVARVAAFHNDLGDFIQWLTQAERRINQAPTISFVPCTLQLQLPAQVALRQEIASKREAALTPLDRAAVFIGSNASEQDVVLVKNLLASAHSRWEKLFQKSADRNRQFAVAFKESQKLMSVWKELTDWLKEELNTRLQESSWCSVSTQPDVLLRELTQHREFQRELGAHSATYDAIRRHLIKVKDRAPRDDLVELNRMLSELKYFWNAVCTKSLEKQKVLEEALLRSGQYKDAFVSLFEWINKIDSLLDDNKKKGCGGDVETVKQLEEAHRSLLAQLQEREASVTKLQTAASQLLTKCRPEGSSDAAGLTDSLVMQAQLAGLNAQWTKVQLKAKARSDNLKLARKNAEEFQKSCQDVFDYCAGAEYTLRKLSALSEGDDPCVMDSRDPLSEEKSVNKEAAAVTSGMAAQESRVCDCLARGNRILSECKNNLDGASRIRQWMNAVNTRWEELLDWSQKREAKLAQLWKDQRERRLTLDALISWLNTTEVILCSDRMYVQPTISMGPLSVDVMSEISSSSSSRFESGSIGFEIDTSQVERLLVEVGQIESELEKRRFQRDEVLKHARKSDVDKKRQANSKGKASEHLPRDQGQAYASVRVNEMCEKWDRVVRIVKARQIALEERLAHANEVEKLKTFDFGNWRRRYLDWMNSKKARLIDMFYRYDLDRDGRLSRDEFVNAILESKFPTSRLELEVVASIVDANGDAYIDMKKFNTALRSTTVPKSQQLELLKIEGSAIEHEAKHQTNLCTCHNTYRISKINGNMYKFGDSQKLRLVRILRSNVMVRVGGGWTPLTEFLVKNDPCRAAFWAGSESERKDAGFPEDQTHMMLRFHPRFRDGSSASVTCTDPTCSGHLDNMPRSSSRRSNPRHASTSGGIPFMCTSPVPTRGMDHLNKKEGHQVPVRSSLPIVASRRKANSLVSFCQSSLSSSAHSLPIVEQSVPGGSHSSPCTEPVELETEATIPPTSPSSSLSERPEDRKGSSRASGMNVTNLIPAEESVSSSTEVDVQQHASLSHLSSILERYEGDDPRLASLSQNEEVEPDLTTATSTTLTQSHMQLPLPRVTSPQQPEVASCETNLPHSGSQVSIGHTTELHPGTALSRTRTTVASFRREINNERF